MSQTASSNQVLLLNLTAAIGLPTRAHHALA